MNEGIQTSDNSSIERLDNRSETRRGVVRWQEHAKGWLQLEHGVCIRMEVYPG